MFLPIGRVSCLRLGFRANREETTKVMKLVGADHDEEFATKEELPKMTRAVAVHVLVGINRAVLESRINWKRLLEVRRCSVDR